MHPVSLVASSTAALDKSNLQRIDNKKAIKCRSCPEVFCKKGVARNFTKFTGKQVSFYCEILKNTFSYRTSPVAASENGIKNKKATKTEYFPCCINTSLEYG